MGEFLTGFSVFGSLYGDLLLISIFVVLVTLIWLIKNKGFVNAIVVILTITTFAGSGALIGYLIFESIFLTYLLAYLFYFLSLKLTLFVLKKQGNKIVFVKSSLGGRNLDDDLNNQDDDF